MKHTDERGTQLLELAVILPLLVFLMLAVIEGASFVRAHQVINNAAREGARMGVIQAVATSTDRDSIIQQTVANYVNTNAVVPPARAIFTLGRCSSWSAAQNVATNWPGAPASVTGTVTVNGTPVAIEMTRVTVTCPYKFSFLPSRYSQMTLKGSTTLADLY